MSTKTLCTWYFLASGCFWTSLISVHGFLALTAQQHFGLPASQATLPLIILHVSVVLLEIPTGIIADSWSRSKCALAGQACVAISLLSVPLIPVLASKFPYFGILVFSLLFASGWSLFSGSLKGLVSNHIRTSQPELMPWFVKQSSLVNNLFILSGTILYPVAYSSSWQLVWLLSGAFALGSIVFTIPLVLSEKKGENLAKRAPFGNLRQAFASFHLNPRLLWLSFASVILFAFATSFESTLQAHATTEILAKWTKLQESPILKLAWLAWFCHTLGSIAASKLTFSSLGMSSRGAMLPLAGMSLATTLIAAYLGVFESSRSPTFTATCLIALSVFLGWFVTLVRNENAVELQLEIKDAASTSTVLSINSLMQDLVASLFLAMFTVRVVGVNGYPLAWLFICGISTMAIAFSTLNLNKVSAKGVSV